MQTKTNQTRQTTTFDRVWAHLEQYAQNPREIAPVGATRVIEADRRGSTGTVVVYVRPDGAWTHSRSRADLYMPWVKS